MSNNTPKSNGRKTLKLRKDHKEADDWLCEIWAWADEFGIPKTILPRDKVTLCACTELNLEGSYGLVDEEEVNQISLKISHLPPAIGKLVNLRKLSLQNNSLTTLPTEIGHLTNLKYLNLMDNQLTELPVAIGQLSALNHLYLGDNQLTELPAEIGQLSGLESLVLWNNKLTSLPAELRKVNNIEKLYLKRIY